MPPETAVPSALDGPEQIHTRRTEIDIEPPPSPFGVSPVVAGALIGLAVVLGGGIALLVSDGDPPATADAGAELVAPLDRATDAGARVVIEDVVDAGAIAIAPPSRDAGVVALVRDAGMPVKPAVRDAGIAVAPTSVDAGIAKPPDLAKAPDAGPAKTPDVPDKAPDPDAEYAARLKAAEALSRKGDFGRSIREYKAALALKPSSVPAHLGLGNAYYEQDTLDAALTHLEKARALSPKEPQAYVLLGAVYQSAGRRDDAITAYKRYLELAPDGRFARDVKGILKGLGAN
jgi:hypothetical protein